MFISAIGFGAAVGRERMLGYVLVGYSIQQAAL